MKEGEAFPLLLCSFSFKIHDYKVEKKSPYLNFSFSDKKEKVRKACPSPTQFFNVAVFTWWVLSIYPSSFLLKMVKFHCLQFAVFVHEGYFIHHHKNDKEGNTTFFLAVMSFLAASVQFFVQSLPRFSFSQIKCMSISHFVF